MQRLQAAPWSLLWKHRHGCAQRACAQLPPTCLYRLPGEARPRVLSSRCPLMAVNAFTCHLTFSLQIKSTGSPWPPRGLCRAQGRPHRAEGARGPACSADVAPGPTCHHEQAFPSSLQGHGAGPSGRPGSPGALSFAEQKPLGPQRQALGLGGQVMPPPPRQQWSGDLLCPPGTALHSRLQVDTMTTLPSRPPCL